MSSANVTLDDWLRSLKQATEEVATTALRFDAKTPVETRPTGSPWPGAYIAILGDDVALHLGISATPAGLARLARGLLGTHESAPLSERDVVDAVSELMNIIAGKVKSRLSDRDTSLRLGLPLFVQGQIQVTEQMEKTTAAQRVGPVACELLVFRNPRSQRRAA